MLTHYRSPASHYYQSLIRSLQRCKISPDLGTAISAHAKIIKLGYDSHPTLMSLLMSAYVDCKQLSLACLLLKEMPNKFFDIISVNLLIANLMKAGANDVARKVFLDVPIRDVVTWNTIIGGYVKQGFFKKALAFFREMLDSNIDPDGFTFSSVITACARLGALDHAKWIHGLMGERRIELNYILSAALIDMYSKCGRIDTAISIFHSTQPNDVSIWNAMINGLAIHGLAVEAISLFSKMEAQNVRPDSITFISILTACSHSGQVVQGRRYFELMQNHYLIPPQLEHFGAMVDLFGRAGLLEEAYKMIKEMPVRPDIVIWRAFLSTCRTHRNLEMSEVAVNNMLNHGSGDYILLSNVYCSLEKWDTAEQTRCLLKKKGIHKDRGKSWIELAGSVHQFKAGDRSHLETKEIYKLLKKLIQRMKTEGLFPNTQLVLMDVSEEEKEENLNYHSEKLALAYGILKSSPGTELLIAKNLRTCLDCHSWMKMVSKVLNRVIVVRDRIRFHRFEDGSCSCGDYW
ncbi:hypothetical protein Leryth_001588 [Lithospermum erythrorhizon]|nr:hypothetical protein Leryth_001588 [Lithospermum erythrorhizon]